MNDYDTSDDDSADWTDSQLEQGDDEDEEIDLLMPTPAPTSDVLPVIIDTYRRCWHEFYEGEQSLCLQALSDLEPAPDASGFSHILDFSYDVETQQGSSHLEIALDGADTFSEAGPTFLVTDFEAGRTVRKRKYKAALVTLPPQEPCPRYHACTPASWYIFTNEEPARANLVSIRYGGVREPTFDERDYMKLFHSVAWQTPYQDPDYNRIAYETVRRLTDTFLETPDQTTRIRLDDIASARIFPPVDFKNLGFKGHMARLRDILGRVSQTRDAWVTPRVNLRYSTSSSNELESEFPEENRIRRLWMLSQNFCAYLECLRSACPLHPKQHTGWRAQSIVSPHKSNAAMKALEEEPCGELCYLRGPDSCVAADIKANELDALDSLFALEPDALPCDLAAVLRGVSCQQVYALRCNKISDDRVVDPPANANYRATLRKFMFCHVPVWDPAGRRALVTKPDFTVRGIVNAITTVHFGADAVGATIDTKPGKSAARTRISSKTSKTKISDAAQCCQNFDLQLGKKKRIEIKSGKYGFGAFAAQHLTKGDFLGDYISTKYIVDKDRTSVARAAIAEFAHLNYAFTLDRKEVLDAFDIGNETRYFNDPGLNSTRQNVDAQVKYVHGNYHIAFYTTKAVKKGAELLFPYGETYWKNFNLTEHTEDDLLFE
ncbi:hypothetical protein NM688_g5581 [Phlebia brevispora]|uniref:Uncharacterized protein n=1 Tax=Phlebia brevispora TaxID=194682 RepID=A0ACC1STJ5_9APHY|nr:hypothetical protein NM688_g5581 [Phlebia brevispora]